MRDIDLLVVGRGAPERGGIPTYVDWLTRRATAAGYRAQLVNLAPTGGSHEGVNGANLTRTLRDTARVARAARRARVVSIHSAGAPTQSLIRLGLLIAAARAAGARAVPHVHGGRLPLWATGPRQRRLLALTMRPAAAVVTVADGGRHLLAQAAPGTLTEWIPNGVDTTAFTPALRDGSAISPARADAGPVVLFVGGLTERKGVLDLFAACTILRERGVAHRLVLVGARPNEGGAAHDKVMAALPEWATLEPPREPAQMPDAYRSGDIFCLPSWWEAMPLTVLEAMATELPVVATDVGDVRSLVDNGRTGLVVAARDPIALADALARLITHPERAIEMGAAGRERAVAQFSAEMTWGQLDALFRSLGARR